MIRTLKWVLVSQFCILTITNSSAQFFPSKNYPQHYFQWPLAAKVAIAANFGELRPNHYHMGLDCKTEKRENIPVLAAAQGYIARVKIEPFGFGRSILINHPNGFSTLYAHLNDFIPELERYITAEQYRLKQWEITLMIPENLFPVKKGAVIAYSGNTGGSQGPHLHFEIRDTKTDKVLNPLLFGFSIPDNIPPRIIRLAVYDRRLSTYEQTPKLYSLKNINGMYHTPEPVIVTTDQVSFAITAYDSYTGSTNQNGIYRAVLSDNGSEIAGFEMDGIGYDETRYLNAHIDYKTRSSGGPFLEHLSRLPGYWDGIYKTKAGDGVIQLKEDSAHKIRIIVSDANGNSSVLEFLVKRVGIKDGGNSLLKGPVFYPGLLNVFDNDKIRFYLAGNMLYDSFHFIFNESKNANVNTVYQVHNKNVPLHGSFPLRIRGNFQLTDTGSIIMKRTTGKKEEYKKANFENGWYKASFRDFGDFELMRDSTPPVVTPVGFKDGMILSRAARIKFSVTDNAEDIGKFTGLLDGNWILFSNDKGRNFIYTFDEHCSPGPHELLITAEDLAGNKTNKTYHFIR